MARHEQDREDLLAEAKALVERASLRIAGRDDDVVVGFRRDAGVSFYFGAERVYHFNSQAQLRRAFFDGLMFKADKGQLISLRRERQDRVVELVSHVLDPAATRSFLTEVRRHLEALGDALTAGTFSVVGQVPEHADVVGRVRRWLIARAAGLELARSPRAG
jgi:hypothetical protein